MSEPSPLPTGPGEPPQPAASRPEGRLREQALLLDLAHVLMRDMSDRIVLWTRGTQQMYGWTPEEALGRLSHELLRTEFPRPLAEIQAELRERGEWEGELVHFRKDGR